MASFHLYSRSFHTISTYMLPGLAFFLLGYHSRRIMFFFYICIFPQSISIPTSLHLCIPRSTTLCLDYPSISSEVYFSILFCDIFFIPIPSSVFSVALSWPAAYSTRFVSAILSLYLIYFILHVKPLIYLKSGFTPVSPAIIKTTQDHYFAAAARSMGLLGWWLHPCPMTIISKSLQGCEFWKVFRTFVRTCPS
ncbi:hypothetical protein BYT27DRAFT_6388980 [Phlegmacium glaucopus]|nr:hypothetical protein BYT27DRAFT_6388980 [Phlegmacium glaucopus]